MKISVSWLKEWIQEIPADLANRLTMAGLEVEGVELAAPAFSGVVIGEVVALEQHPDADRLRVAQVNVGQEAPIQIVCGAPNVAVGIKVPTALVGAVLPGDFKIKDAKLRGVASSGMLCSAKELGLNEDASGLMILDSSLTVGADFREVLHLDDEIVEIDLTPNRGDCLSILGVARDLAAMTGQSVRAFEEAPLTVESTFSKQVVVDNPTDCPKYLGCVIENVNPKAPSPLWMQERLRRSGIRPHGILVDVTNYVLLEVGQPLHAFDIAKIEGDLHVRRARQGEALTLINEDKVTLREDTLVIADEKKVLAMAGIMGGLESGCDDTTTTIFLEAAWFNPLTIAGRARNYGLHTDSSHRFERGVDFALAEKALAYAASLIREYAGGKAGPVTRIVSEDLLPKRLPIKVRFCKINQIIGQKFTNYDINTLLSRVGNVTEVHNDYLIIEPPSYRFDLQIEEDFIEEVARLNGYDEVPVSFEMLSQVVMNPVPESKVKLADFKQILVDRGFYEVIEMSFTSPTWQAILDPGRDAIALKNPISNDLSVMRTTLLPGVLGAMDHNLKRQQTRLRFFESGRTYNGTLENPVQVLHIAGAICGTAAPLQWGVDARAADFFDLKGDVEALLKRTGRKDFCFVPSEREILHPGQRADIKLESGETVGYLGKLHPSVVKALDLNRDIFVFELNYDLLSQSETPKFQALSRFPVSKRDLALVVPASVTTQQIVDVMQGETTPRKYLVSVNLFDIYAPKNHQDEKASKNMAFSLTFQNREENLKDVEIDQVVAEILSDLTQLGVTLRQ
ncbi:phenylalanine--tRNA ligase subunit beta [Ignatzschineria ureiclastica]|uniref:Phenylalanine--tRNA ligase beta subunit n=1 Tax=Ignatzschineria ureiclastica TaxID=472582 RepID=A0A2U2AD34_9GAMM|nr:phenylalanine--tRNA ligase subunit beta [Ignatzschineria ureiclastica]PWD80575.1 phenylalanine--tRNA ligase subunit beta [Ignatzschineria ureiclastica]GHA02470.1 phenylalanine--tRNA ligase beta subunit [Ignatzschineria ureiclastica]